MQVCSSSRPKEILHVCNKCAFGEPEELPRCREYLLCLLVYCRLYAQKSLKCGGFFVLFFERLFKGGSHIKGKKNRKPVSIWEL